MLVREHDGVSTLTLFLLVILLSLGRQRNNVPSHVHLQKRNIGLWRMQHVFWSIWSIWDVGAWKDLAHGRSSTGHAKEEGGSHLEDQLDHLLDQPVEFLNSTGQASTRSS
ncbi:unnamed protein product [Microthlaspi erraticum]|uniref:Secreted protein n=1 Tax=Microthlaspi erraticum TaxID=1685480 RepID=A0A6D2J5D3_9BRAS|nr:unnamed protein product [Microthlaspi erraticum]